MRHRPRQWGVASVPPTHPSRGASWGMYARLRRTHTPHKAPLRRTGRRAPMASRPRDSAQFLGEGCLASTWRSPGRGR
eukprot:474181-Pleurochrysis_carterae.AAC.1